jgi:hypothetical protein
MLRASLLTVCCLGCVAPLVAGDHDKKSDRWAKPAGRGPERIEQLIQVLVTERKDDRRAKAAQELGKLASPEYPEIISALIDTLVRDESSSVRKAAAKSLGDIEPESHEVKDALDQAVKQDKSWVVRQAARMALWRYKPKDEPPSVPGPQLRQTSKPTSTGMVAAKSKRKPKDEPPTDPFKSVQPLPVIPLVPANDPPLLPPPGSKPGAPVRLAAPGPGAR